MYINQKKNLVFITLLSFICSIFMENFLAMEYFKSLNGRENNESSDSRIKICKVQVANFFY